MASISIPMWFPPVPKDGHTYLDAVFLSDANLEEAIDRGADELWVIWTVSERSEWWAGFVGNYFGIIETVANGNFRRVLQANRAQQRRDRRPDGPGSSGVTSTVKVLRAEVPVHYLLVASGDRVRECVERGVLEASAMVRRAGHPAARSGCATGRRGHHDVALHRGDEGLRVARRDRPACRRRWQPRRPASA